MSMKQLQELEESKTTSYERQKVCSTKTKIGTVERAIGYILSARSTELARPTLELARSSGPVEWSSVGILTALLDPT